MKWAYGNGMQTVAGQKIRDELMTAPVNDRCPLCRQGAVRQLDHFMPKSLFPSLCVDPLNLVPVCGECNLIKGNKSPDRAGNTLLHPYLDRISHQRWLDAQVVHDSGSVRLKFFVSPPTSWDSTLRARVEHHFTLFDLGHRYAVDANRVICDVAHCLDQLRARPGGAAIVRDYLQDEAETRLSQEPNSIEGVTYAALAADDHYCRGG
ncbi:hypothetical protein [Streptomyces sp. NBC_01233]|uniref:hypothetical protein n=1 Tax=Streptomyces sp. NBC_01233 TaxID=2903787 RepID=UPI002E0E5E98|nr:hypothetical protein OG332_23160 [Streptomyces sp. NBC_01233]